MTTPITKKDYELLKDKYPSNIDAIEKKLDNDYPVQYLIGNVNFYGYQIEVNEDVLIPRFETETLIEKTINYIKKMNIEKPCILDIGTGSGCISIVLKKELECNITAIDISEKALKVARKNADINKVNLEFVQKDILNENIDGIYNVIISNPPYLTEEDEVSANIAYEPQNALYADDNGLIFYKEIIKKTINHISKKSIIAFETGDKQKDSIIAIAKNYYPESKIVSEKDLSGRDRYIFIINE